jgi:hypothetical protein
MRRMGDLVTWVSEKDADGWLSEKGGWISEMDGG